MDRAIIRDYFAKLDLESDIADIYMALYTHGPQTVSQLARNAGVERTKLYRLMGSMTDAHLCEIEVQSGHTRVSPTPIEDVQLLITEREQRLSELRANLGRMEVLLNAQKAAHVPATRIQCYNGEAGLKQMLWNETRYSAESVSILAESMQTYTGGVFFERWVRKCNERALQSRSIVGDSFLVSIRTWYAAHQNERLGGWRGRYVPGTIFRAERSMVLHGDVVMYYGRKAGEMFGIEIHDQQLADMQRQFFEMLWAQGTDLSRDQARPHADTL